MTKRLVKRFALLLFLLPAYMAPAGASDVSIITNRTEAVPKRAESPKIVHIVNFIRLLEPRDPAITEEILYQTVVKQVALMNRYGLPGTFLLQYDALLDKRYQHLLRSLPKDRFEIGGWLEVPQPLAENAGLKWRGNAPWDSRADVDFTTGYTPKEREKLIDTYMRDFKRIFGHYPKTVGCWYLDAYSIDYMYRKYGITASCNCKDQIGTDGYTLWGGYWNQAYYPSRVNAYMPAQTKRGQIPVPIFRMLGSDPIRQYDDGIGTQHQGVITLEPVYKFGGGDSTWVNWFFKTLTQGEAMAFGYTQAGQENSFTWQAMQAGLQYQLRHIAALRKQGQVQVETMAQTADWFKTQFKLTPVTAVTALEDLPGKNQQSVWLDTRFYRINLLWDHHQLWIRDIHLFDERVTSPYFTKNATGSKCTLFTLPFVDGHFWSAKSRRAGLQFLISKDGKLLPMEGGQPVVRKINDHKMEIRWPLKDSAGILRILLSEGQMAVNLIQTPAPSKWCMQLVTAGNKELPFKKINSQSIQSRFMGHNYLVKAVQGHFEPGVNSNTATVEDATESTNSTAADTANVAFNITADQAGILLDFSER